jgi:hypothetical protein
MKSKNDTSVSDDSNSEINNLKNKSETEKPVDDAPNDRENERIARAKRQTSKVKSFFNPNPKRFPGRELVLKKLA